MQGTYSSFIQPVLYIHFFLKKTTLPQPTCRHAVLLPQEVVNTATRAAGSQSLLENKLSHSPTLIPSSISCCSHILVSRCSSVKMTVVFLYSQIARSAHFFSADLPLFRQIHNLSTVTPQHDAGRAHENAGIVKTIIITRC